MCVHACAVNVYACMQQLAVSTAVCVCACACVCMCCALMHVGMCVHVPNLGWVCMCMCMLVQAPTELSDSFLQTLEWWQWGRSQWDHRTQLDLVLVAGQWRQRWRFPHLWPLIITMNAAETGAGVKATARVLRRIALGFIGYINQRCRPLSVVGGWGPCSGVDRFSVKGFLTCEKAIYRKAVVALLHRSFGQSCPQTICHSLFKAVSLMGSRTSARKAKASRGMCPACGNTHGMMPRANGCQPTCRPSQSHLSLLALYLII